MKKTILKSIVITTVLGIVSVLNASPYTFNTKSLVGIEGSYNSFDVEHDSTSPTTKEKAEFAGLGFKIGSQSDNYRLFLSARNNFIDEYSYAYSMGVEGQYLMNFSSWANMFFGVAGGYYNLRFDDVNSVSRELSSPYIGGDVGFNIHLGDGLDFELGGRVVKLSESSHLQNGVTYNFDNIVTGYASLIFKYSMDKY